MSDSQQGPWSDNPNAPKILRNEYYIEKVLFAGNFLATIPYGMHGKPPPPSVRAHFICPTYSRDRHHAVLQMHGRAV